MLEVKDILKIYDNKKILNNFSNIFKIGKINIILGSSGKGKSTLLKILAGLIEIDFGEFIFENEIICKEKIKNFYIKNCIYVPQSPFFFSDLRINKYIELINYNFYYKKNELEFLIELFELKNNLNNYPCELSGGQKYRLSLLFVLISNKKIILLDEPTAHLDKNISEKIMNYLNKIKKNKIFIIATHDLFLLSYADEIINL